MDSPLPELDDKVVKEHLSKFRFIEPTSEKDAGMLAGFWHVFFNNLLDDIEQKKEPTNYWIQSRLEHLLGRCGRLCIYCGEQIDDI